MTFAEAYAVPTQSRGCGLPLLAPRDVKARSMEACLTALAGRQSQVLHRRQLRACGVTGSKTVAQLRAGRWQRVGSVVIALHSGPLTTEQRRWAALLNAGSRAAFAARTALELGGLRGWEVDEVHLSSTARHCPRRSPRAGRRRAPNPARQGRTASDCRAPAAHNGRALSHRRRLVVVRPPHMRRPARSSRTATPEHGRTTARTPRRGGTDPAAAAHTTDSRRHRRWSSGVVGD